MHPLIWSGAGRGIGSTESRDELRAVHGKRPELKITKAKRDPGIGKTSKEAGRDQVVLRMVRGDDRGPPLEHESFERQGIVLRLVRFKYEHRYPRVVP